MNYGEAELALINWAARYARLNRVTDEHCRKDGDADLQSELYQAIWKSFEADTQHLDQLLQANGKLTWYCVENDMGRLSLPGEKNGQTLPIQDLAGLLWLID